MVKKSYLLFAVLYIIFATGGELKYLNVHDKTLVNTDSENPTPILGILTQKLTKRILMLYPNKSYTSYIAASYVKFVEGAGGRVVPICVLLPGGIRNFNQSGDYAEAGRHIYELAMELNNNGTYFPVWGTCLGFELLVYLSANSTEPRTDCSSSAQPLPLEFVEGYQNSRLFRNASTNIINILKNYPVTANSHWYCITEETFSEMKLNEIWDVMSVNHDWEGLEFISTIEHKNYPFYGTQFHPEKNIYEFIRKRNITHSSRAIQASQYFANFLVSEARKNCQHFENLTEEAATLIYNYSPVYSGLVGCSFVQQYLFEFSNNLESNSADNIFRVNLISIILSFISSFKIYKFWL